MSGRGDKKKTKDLRGDSGIGQEVQGAGAVPPQSVEEAKEEIERKLLEIQKRKPTITRTPVKPLVPPRTETPSKRAVLVTEEEEEEEEGTLPTVVRTTPERRPSPAREEERRRREEREEQRRLQEAELARLRDQEEREQEEQERRARLRAEERRRQEEEDAEREQRERRHREEQEQREAEERRRRNDREYRDYIFRRLAAEQEIDQGEGSGGEEGDPGAEPLEVIAEEEEEAEVGNMAQGGQLASLPEFDGTNKEAIETFCSAIDRARENFGWNDAVTARSAQAKLKGSAAFWLESQKVGLEKEYNIWDAGDDDDVKLKVALIRRYRGEVTTFEASEAVQNLKQKEKESVYDFYDRVVWSVDRKNTATFTAEEKQNAGYRNGRNADIYMFFCNGLNDKVRTLATSGQDPPTTHDALLQAALKAEKNIEKKKLVAAVEVDTQADKGEEEKKDEDKISLEELKKEIAALKAVKQQGNLTCYRCGKAGHFARDCTDQGNRGRGRGGRRGWRGQGRGYGNQGGWQRGWPRGGWRGGQRGGNRGRGGQGRGWIPQGYFGQMGYDPDAQNFGQGPQYGFRFPGYPGQESNRRSYSLEVEGEQGNY